MKGMGPKCACCLGLSGLLSICLGIITPTLFHILVKSKLKQMLPLEVGSYTYEKWRDLPVPMDMQIYVFDVVNADEVKERGVKPYVKEKGPYTYRLKKEKVDITFNSNSTVSYRQLTWYYFDRSRSVGDESDTFTTINNILLGAGFITRFEYPVVKELVKLFLEAYGGNLYEKYTVRDIVWGYEDPMLKIVKDDILKPLNLNVSFDDHFGFFYRWNGSDDGLFTVFTGKNDLTRFNYVSRFNGLGNVPYWSSPAARMINGTDGTLFPPFLNKDTLYFYSAEACRTLYLDYERETNVKSIDTYRYVLPASLLESGLVNSNNVGFCTPDVTHCMPSGVLNSSACRNGSSAVLSYPHFLGGDPEVINGVEGLHPDKQQHQSFIDFEPMTGVPMDAKIRLQIGVYVSNFSSAWQLKNARTYFHPILWFNESVTISDKLADELRSELILAVHIVNVVHYLLPFVGAMLVVLVIGYYLRKRTMRWRHKESLNKSDAHLSPANESDRLISPTN